MRIKAVVVTVALFFAGFGCGGYLFSKTLPRSFLPTNSCNNHCYSVKKLAGLFASVGIQQASFLVPMVVLESDTCLAVKYPKPRTKVHYVLFPKRDIKNIATITPEDVPYVMGCFAMVRELVQRDKLETYVVSTNGPGKQDIELLHFHLYEP